MVLLKKKIKEKAGELGFSSCGFASPKPLEREKEWFFSYLEEKRYADLHYLARNFEKRFDPELLFPGTKTVIGLLFNYYPAELLAEEDNFIISKYAYGRDYHRLLKERTAELVRFIDRESADVRTMAFIDSGQIPEKAWAQRCGLGWIGKNTILINPEKGSFHFIVILFTTLGLEPDIAGTDRCGGCSRCLEACPTDALELPWRLNPANCISYLTIETKNKIPDSLKSRMKDRIYGCDICQDVCPFNRNAVPNLIPDLQPPEILRSFHKSDWKNLDEQKFRELFNGRAMERAGYEKITSNIRDASSPSG